MEGYCIGIGANDEIEVFWQNQLGMFVFPTLDNQPVFGLLFSGGRVPGMGGGKTLLP